MLCTSTSGDFTVPGSSKHSVDDGALGILCADEENILWKTIQRTFGNELG